MATDINKPNVGRGGAGAVEDDLVRRIANSDVGGGV